MKTYIKSTKKNYKHILNPPEGLINIYIFLTCLTVYSLGFLLPPSVKADGISISAYPSLLEIEMVPPASANAPITLENQGGKSLNIQVLLKPFRSSNKENGQITYLDKNEIPDKYKKIFNKARITDNGIIASRFELGPKQKKNLELQIIIPKNEPESDYYFSVIFLASDKNNENRTASQSSMIKYDSNYSANETDQPPDGQNFSTISAGIAVNVLLTVGLKNYPQGEIEEFSVPAYLKSGPVAFTVRIKNTGAHVIAPRGIIFIKNMFGQTIGRIDLDPRNILYGSIRALTDTQTASDSSSLQINLKKNKSIQKAIWQERFLIGPYTATLNISLSDKGPIFNQSIFFLVLPVPLIISLILGILLIIIIFLRVKHHLKTDK